MKKQAQGFILLMTLLIIGIISLFTLTSMQHLLLYHKAVNQQEEQHQNFYLLEHAALHLAHQNLSAMDQSCVVQQDSANQVINDLVHHKGCSLESGSLHYKYLIEDLGTFPCFMIQLAKKKHATHHRRVSVVQMEEGVPVSVLQIRFITVGGIATCYENEHFISLGVSSWRYLGLQ